METRYYLSKNLNFKVERNEDGTLLLTDTQGNPYKDAGCLIKCQGGVEKFFSRCLDEETYRKRLELREYYNSKEYKAAQAQKKAEREAIAAAAHQAAFQALPLPIPVTYENIRIVLNYLRDYPYGGVQLPSMTVGYSFNMYDCDGHLAAAMILDDDLIEDGENLGRRFVVGAPVGHLMKYKRCR